MEEGTKEYVMGIFSNLKESARKLRRKVHLIYILYLHPETPLLAKTITFITLGLALSPIDFIPDFIPIFGYLDDLIFVPLGVYLTLKITPRSLIDKCNAKIDNGNVEELPTLKFAGVLIVVFWVIVLGYFGYLIHQFII